MIVAFLCVNFTCYSCSEKCYSCWVKLRICFEYSASDKIKESSVPVGPDPHVKFPDPVHFRLGGLLLFFHRCNMKTHSDSNWISGPCLYSCNTFSSRSDITEGSEFNSNLHSAAAPWQFVKGPGPPFIIEKILLFLCKITQYRGFGSAWKSQFFMDMADRPPNNSF